MTWSARIEHTPAGLALTFGAPLSRLDMAPDVAAHLASLLAVEARHRLAGVVSTLEAVFSHESPARPYGAVGNDGNSRPSRRTTHVDCRHRLAGVVDGLNPVRAENTCTSVEQTSAHALQRDCDDCLNGGRL